MLRVFFFLLSLSNFICIFLSCSFAPFPVAITFMHCIIYICWGNECDRFSALIPAKNKQTSCYGNALRALFDLQSIFTSTRIVWLDFLLNLQDDHGSTATWIMESKLNKSIMMLETTFSLRHHNCMANTHHPVYIYNVYYTVSHNMFMYNCTIRILSRSPTSVELSNLITILENIV